MSARRDLLLVGRWPPPVGGVTVHVERLSRGLASAGVVHSRVDARRDGLVAVVRAIACHRVCHIHVSHPALLALLVAWSRACRTRSIVTLHGNFGRFGGWRRSCVSWALGACDIPILLNEPSYQEARRLHPQPIRLSAFLPPAPGTAMVVDWSRALTAHAARFRSRGPLVATNAFDLAFDGDGREIYGVFALAAWCAQRGIGLVVCDPSGRYQAEAKNRDPAATSTSLFLTGPHSFEPVLEYCDVYVRNTITDGDSLSVHEALALGKPVWATDVVPRPAGTYIYGSLDEIDLRRAGASDWTAPAVLGHLIAIYRGLLCRSDVDS